MAPDEQLRATARRFIERWRLVSPTETRKGGGGHCPAISRSIGQASVQAGRQTRRGTSSNRDGRLRSQMRARCCPEEGVDCPKFGSRPAITLGRRSLVTPAAGAGDASCSSSSACLLYRQAAGSVGGCLGKATP